MDDCRQRSSEGSPSAVSDAAVPSLSSCCHRALATAGPDGAVSLGQQHERWQRLKHSTGLHEDAAFAQLLLDVLEQTIAKTILPSTRLRCGSGNDVPSTDLSRDFVKAEFSGNPIAVSVPFSLPRLRQHADLTRSYYFGNDEDDENDEDVGRAAMAASLVQCTTAGSPARTLADMARSLLPVCRPSPLRKKPAWYVEAVLECDLYDGGRDVIDAHAGVTSRERRLPTVEPELLAYFSCNLCEAGEFGELDAYFGHLWTEHTELQAVGGRVQRVPIRLRPQLFVLCALCGVHNTGSLGEEGSHLTVTHLPRHESLLRCALIAAARHKCDECPAQFDELAALALHCQDAGHECPPHHCPSCRLELDGEQNYIDHLAEHYVQAPFQCYFCMSLFSSEPACVAHVKRHHQQNYTVHRCALCGYHTALLHDFVSHVRCHSRLNQQMCDVCGATFTSKSSLRAHASTHKSAQFPCGACDKVFAHPQTLRRHELNAHGRPERCVCPECGRQFVSVYSMRRHRMTHSGLKPHQCDKCGRGYVQRNDLKLHARRCKYGAPETVLAAATETVLATASHVVTPDEPLVQHPQFPAMTGMYGMYHC